MTWNGRASFILVFALVGCAQSLDAKRQTAALQAPQPAPKAALPASSRAPSMMLFNKTVIYVKDAYFDPKRIDPRQMLVGAVQSIARTAPELRVDVREPMKVKLASNDIERTFDISHVDSVWKMSFLFGDIYTELVGPMGIPDDERRIGFAATNGMLATLDPFSALLPSAVRSTPNKVPPEGSVVASLGTGIGYVRLRNLPPKASRDLELALEEIRQKLGGTLRGLVLDLRGNHGGLLEQAVAVVNLFVEDGVIVRTVALGGRQVEDRRAKKSAMGCNAPLIVLIDERTAAGGEVVASALKDLGRALIIGQRTIGAGTVQVLYEYGDVDGFGKAYLYLTIAAMFRSTGAPIEQRGLIPDVLVRASSSPGEEVASSRATPRNPVATFTDQRGESDERPAAEIAEVRREPAHRTTVEELLLEDQEVKVARDLLVNARTGQRSELLAGARALGR